MKATPLVIAIAALSAGGSFAATITSLVGDKDGFGLPGAPAVPADGTLWRDTLGGIFYNDYRDANDLANAPFTDIWSLDAAVNYNHAYSLAGGIPVSATLSVQIAGVADNGDAVPRGPWDVKINGVTIGSIGAFFGENAFQETHLLSFSVPIALLTSNDGILLNINVPSVVDGYAINFSELTIETRDVGGVPEGGATFLLLGIAGLTIGAIRRR